MSDTDTTTETEQEAPSAPSEAVLESTASAPESEPATEPETIAPVGDAKDAGEPDGPAAVASSPVPTDLFDADMKAWFRANVRWVIAELDHVRAGRTEEERADLNP